MDKYELQKLRDLPIEGVAERLGLQVTRHKCLCPFHDDHHASLSFCVRRNTFRCFVCGASGGPIDLVMKYLRKPFLEACEWLNPLLTSPRGGREAPSRPPQGGGDFPIRPPKGRSSFFSNCSSSLPLGGDGGGVIPSGGGRGVSFYARFFEHPWLNDEARRFLFEERRIDPRVVRWCRLTSWRDKQGVPWLQTPYYDRDGKLIGVQNRNLTPSKPSTPSIPPRGEAINHSPSGEMERGFLPRFRFPAGSQCSIYNLPVLNLLKPGETLYITEGCSDCWAMLSAGHKAIAIPSATLLKRKDVELLKSLEASPRGGLEGAVSPRGDKEGVVSPRGDLEGAVSFAMYPDNDVPGERLFLQLKEVLPNLVRHQLPPGCKDFSDYYLLMKKA